MAENEKTYKTTIEVDTKDAAKNMELLEKTVDTSLGSFDNLNEAISKTQDTLGKLDPKSAEFKELSKELSTLKDNLRDTEIQSVRFTEALAAQPGVIGFVGQSLEGLRGTFQVFMANPIIAVLAGIAGAFLALRESLTRTEEGQKKLTKITSGFTKILNGLFAIIEPIAMALADLVIGLFESESVMNGVSKVVGVLTGVFTTLFGTLKSVAGFIIGTLVNNFKTLIGVAKGAGEVIAGVFSFDWDRIKEGANAAFDAVKEGVKGTVDNVKELGNGIVDAAVDGFNAGEKQFKEGFSRLTEAEKEEAEKAEEERKKREEERKKALEEAQKVQTEAYLALLDDRNRELYLREEKYQEDLKKLKEAGITDFTQLEEVYRKDVQAINDKYDAEAIAKQEEQIAKQKEVLDGLTEYRAIENELNFQRNEEQFNREIAQINDKEKMLLSIAGLSEEERDRIQNEASLRREQAQRDRYQRRIDILNEQEANFLANVNQTEQLLLQNEQLTEDERTAIKLQAEQQRTQIQLDFTQQRRDVRTAELDDELLSLDSELANLATTYDRRLEIVNEKEQLLLEQEGLTEAQRTEIVRAAAQEREAIRQEELQAQADIQNASLDLLGQFGSFLQQIAGENKKLAIAGVIAEQAAAIGKIVVNTSIANAKAVAASPLTFGQPFVAINTISAGIGIASAIAAAVKAVREIKASDKGAPAGKTAVPRPAAPASAASSIPQIASTDGEANTGAQIAETIAATQQASTERVAGTMEKQSDKPLKAYVVSGDVSSQQALDRRVTQSATFG